MIYKSSIIKLRCFSFSIPNSNWFSIGCVALRLRKLGEFLSRFGPLHVLVHHLVRLLGRAHRWKIILFQKKIGFPQVGDYFRRFRIFAFPNLHYSRSWNLPFGIFRTWAFYSLPGTWPITEHWDRIVDRRTLRTQHSTPGDAVVPVNV